MVVEFGLETSKANRFFLKIHLCQFTMTDNDENKRYEMTRFNSVKHGLRSSVTVLPHESKEAFEELRDKFIAEYLPQGPTENVLVEELASIVWRKRRVLTAEAASLNDGLERTINFPKRLINTSWPFHLHINDSGDDGGEIERELRSLLALDEDGLREHKKHLAEMRESLKAAGERLAQGGKGAARQAFGLLAEDLQDLWYATSRCSNTKEDIENFILNEVSQKVDNAEEITNCVTEIRQQAAGSSFHGFPFEQIARYEAHLDRKFERTLSMLLKLKEIRGNQDDSSNKRFLNENQTVIKG